MIGRPPELRFRTVGTFQGLPFDLVVSMRTPGDTITPPPGHRMPVYSGCDCRSGFGMIAIHAGTMADLRFTFRDSVTDEVVTLRNFIFSAFDLERHEVIQVAGYERYFLR